jgi:aminoglycoside 6'-N-acetyltransferase
MAGVMWPPIAIATGAAGGLAIRVATQADAPTLARWDAEPSVIACTTDDPNAEQAFAGAVWADEIAANGDLTCYYIAELDGRPIGAMQVIDPHREPTHYWGEIEPNLRAIDIWIGDAADRNQGWGALMMGAVIDACFADGAVAAVIIDPLNSNADAHRFYRRLGFKPTGRRLFNGQDDCLVHRLERTDWRQGN